MKSAAPLVATVLLHLALIVMLSIGLPDSHQARVQPVPVTVALLSPPPAAPPQPAQPEPALSPAAKPLPLPQPERPRKLHKPRVMRTPAPIAQPRTEPAPATAAKSIEAPPNAKPAISASAPSPVTQPQAAPPVRTEVSIPASYAAQNPFPPYPGLSQSNGEEGTVMLDVLVQPDGSAGDVQIKTSSGYPLLDKSARTTVRSWRFNPATVDGKPIARWYQVPIQFKLPDN